MMNNYLRNITPDSFSGLIFAMEGIVNTVVLINGPTGCKFYHSSMSENQSMHQLKFDPLNYPEKWYFGQPRVPCTYLDSRDYVYGSKEKLTEALEFLRDNISFDLLAVINSPGASLIGDDLKRIALQTIKNKKYITIETPGFSDNICMGFETAAMEIFKQLCFPQSKVKTERVNILGLSVFHKNYRGDIAEIKRLFKMCHIEINCFLCSECSLESIEDIPAASLNIVLNPEYGYNTAKLLEKMYGTPFYICDGPPIGFKSTEKFIKDICKILRKDSAPFMRESEKSRADAYVNLSRVNSLTGLPKGVNFAVEGTFSEIYSYTSFIVKYFGMILESASILNEQSDLFKEKTQELLKSFNLENALHSNILDTKSELVFANGNTIAMLKLKGHTFSGIETSLPSMGYVDVIPKTHLGLTGALMITEQIINGLMFM
jgi:nitrogenase molybdenum-iron protein alpha/beta subunit